MATDKDLFLNVGHLSGLGMNDLNGDDAVAQNRPGTIAWIVDAFGPRIVKYVKNVSGSAMGKAELMAYASDTQNTKTTSIANITSGTTTSAVTSGLTANRHDGMICFVLDNADSAGAAPEGESSIVSKNTATVITLDANYPFSTALAVNDDLELVSTYQVEDAADGDESWTCAGVVLGRDDVSDGHYGWIQVQGTCPAKHTTNAISEGDPVVAGAAVVDAFGSDGQELWVGTAMVSSSTDEVLKNTLVDVSLFAHTGTGASP